MNKLHILFLKGLPASGKSTFAQEYIKKHENCVIANKDTLRRFFPKCSEKTIIQKETELVRNALQQGQSVIIDNTHFNPIHEERYREIAEEFGAIFEVKYFDVDPVTCLLQNRQRDEKFRVPDKVITGMYRDNIYKEHKGYEIKGTTVICDIDGTVAYKCDRDIFDYKKVEGDFANMILFRILEILDEKGFEIVFLSGRENSCLNETIAWIDKNYNGVYSLFMREAGDRRDDTIVKAELFDKHLKDKSIFCVFDDRPKVVRMWKSKGLYVFNCNQEPWNLEF